MTDIRKFAVEETGVIHLRDGDDELMYADDAQGKPDKSKPMQIVVFGPGSKTFARAQAAQNNKVMERLKRKGKTEQTAAERAAETAEFLAACTKSFENIEYDKLEGEALFKAVYADSSIGFIADQVNKHLGDWANFTKGANKS